MLKLEIYFPNSPLLLCVAIGCLFTQVVFSHIPIGSKLSVSGNDYWVSSNRDFAFGFFNRSDQPNQYSVGIFFNSQSVPVDKRAVVWVAGGDVSVGINSFVELTDTGDLVLFDSTKGSAAWTSNTSQSSVASAVLGDNGNLILLNGDQIAVWESFQTPSDTLLPGQNLSLTQMLRAASRNSVSSYYSLFLDISGLKLRWESSVIYWISGSASKSNVRAVLTSDGAFQLLNNMVRPVWSAFGEDHNDSSVSYRFLRLDVDGNLRMYSWIESSKSWRSVWQAIKNQCDVFATCGLCGICVFSEQGSPVCKCAFVPGSTADSNSKCLAPYTENCNSGSTMVMLPHTYLYGIYPPHESVTHKSLQHCRESCRKDPLCTAVTVVNDGTAQCRMKQTRYISGYAHPSVMSLSFVKMCLDPVATVPKNFPASLPSSPPPVLKGSRSFCIPCLIGASSGAVVTFVVIQFAIGFCFFKRGKSTKKTANLAYKDPNLSGLIMLSYAEIKDLTENFKQQLGPKLFKGMLTHKQEVVVKNLEASIEQKKFRSAVSIIGSIHHKNLVKLEGYCCEAGHRFLVYELAKNGSVDKWIDDPKLSKRLTWRKRMEICLGVARAIAYLHSGCREFINHGNLKCENVVLNEELEAQVTEFGLGRVIDGACHSGGAAEGDTASFGQMVMRLICGRRLVEDISEWAYKEWMEGRAESVIDERMEGGVDGEELDRALRIAFWCMQVDEQSRPSMGEVVKVLEGTLTVDPPPPPYICQRLPEDEELSRPSIEEAVEVLESTLTVDTLPPPYIYQRHPEDEELSRPSMGEVVEVLEGKLTVDPLLPHIYRSPPEEKELSESEHKPQNPKEL